MKAHLIYDLPIALLLLGRLVMLAALLL